MASSVTVKCKAAILFLQDAMAPRSCTYVSSKHRDKAVLCVGGLGKHPQIQILKQFLLTSHRIPTVGKWSNHRLSILDVKWL